MRKRIVISGINGFVGHHLARELSRKGIDVIGIGTNASVPVELTDVVTDYFSQNLVNAWPETGDVDGVIHLAGLASVGPSFNHPQRYIDTNSAMVTNLCEYYVGRTNKPRILIVSSGAIYKADQPLPITENGEIGVTSPYAVSKVLVENQAAYYRNRDLDCVIARPFNHIGPGQSEGFILPDFYKRIQETDGHVIDVGNIETKRDYTDVRDIVKAYVSIILAQKLNYPIYNICSGDSVSGRQILGTLKQVLKRDDITFHVDKSLVRPTDILDIKGDPTRMRTEFAWRPTHSIEDTIKDFITNKKEK